MASTTEPGLGRRDGALAAASAPDLLQALTAHTPVGVFVSGPDGECVFVNERWTELSGLSATEALGDGWSAALHPDDQERVAAEWRAAAVEARDSVVEYRFLRRDGTVAWVQGYASAVYGSEGLLGWVGSCLDVTEFRTAMQELTNERETFRAAFDHAPIGMALVSPSGQFLRVNAAFCQIVGDSAPRLLGSHFQDITHPDDLDADVELVKRLLAGEIPSYKLEKRYLHPDRSSHWVAISVSLIRDGRGQPLHFVVHVEDIHQRKRAERRLRRQADRDALTGLLNRRRLIEGLKNGIEQRAAGTETAVLILVDLDRFKSINDGFGHPAGDRVLIAVGRALQRSLGRNDLIARLGGDEFAVIARCGSEPCEGERLAELLLDAVRACNVEAEDVKITVTASAGVAQIEARATAVTVIEAADRALYRAKLGGRDRVGSAHQNPKP
jgi:diguanylate cyclase (GGDEF)-like protein/PAS domain S-box-containing protein